MYSRIVYLFSRRKKKGEKHARIIIANHRIKYLLTRHIIKSKEDITCRVLKVLLVEYYIAISDEII